jgi:hypothetical protein
MAQTPKSSSLCGKCSQLFASIEIFSNSYKSVRQCFEHYGNRALLSRAGQGCHLCNLLAAAVDPRDDGLPVERIVETRNVDAEQFFIKWRTYSTSLVIQLKNHRSGKRMSLMYRPLKETPRLGKPTNST